jgi:nicotinate-nucleotide--dimethylbenzimidazole phosphoribosyltransferase
MNIKIDSLNQEKMEVAQKRLDSIAKPINSLGKLEGALIKLAGIFEDDKIDISKKCTLVMCADNGVVAEGVTQAGQDVTRIMAEGMTRNRATINILSAQSNAEVIVVDVGIASEVHNDRIINRKIMYGTNNLYKQPAMSREQALEAIRVGIDMVGELKEKGFKMIATGEMGIGNTTSSSAITACLLNKSPAVVTGKGAGLAKEGLARKIHVIEEALRMHKPNANDPIDVLSKVGGLDIAALAGVYLGGGIHRIPILIDGFISSVAALIAVKLCPIAKDYMFATHISKEPAGMIMIEELGLPHFLDLDMCVGEGTGAAIAFNIFDMAIAVYNNMSDFGEMSIESYVPLA